MLTHFYRGMRYAFFFIFVQITILYAQPMPTRQDIQIRELATVGTNSLRIKIDHTSGYLYILENDGDIKRVNLEQTDATFTTVYQASDHGVNNALGMAFAPDGTLFIVGNETNQSNNQLGTGIIVKGSPASLGSEERTWVVLAETVEYLYGFTYNHRMSGIAVDPNGDFIYVNSGARTDHGEMREGFREVGLTSIILKLPANGENIILEDDREWLRTNGYLMAEGIRNDFDLAFNGNGDLFSVENSGDRDDPEEMNWIQEGHHYGFPWVIGGNLTPQQFTPYEPRNDSLLSPNAWGGGNLYATFSNDPSYPSQPDGISFTHPIRSSGPDADKFRDTTRGSFGVVRDASNLGLTVSTFSTHRSPNGIVFDKDSVLLGDLSGGAFVISLANGGLLQALGDSGEDLLHVALTKTGELYNAQVTRLVSNFNEPLGIELVGNTLYVLETNLWSGPNPNPKLWEITLPAIVVPVELTSFTAAFLDKKVILNWTTASELNNNGFEIQRKTFGGNFVTIGFVRGAGTTTNQNDYSYTDNHLIAGKYFYRLKQIDYNGQYDFSETIEVDVKPYNSTLEQNYPNPFNPITNFEFQIADRGLVSLKIYDVLGNEVNVVINKELPAGTHKYQWNADGLASGIYFYQLKTGNFSDKKKLILMK